ncbi:M48 family metallopeptidase [candidate division KSB1 bacterium]
MKNFLKLLFITIFLVSCGANLFTTQQEVEMGSEFAKEIEKEYELLENPEWEEYINEIGNKIFAVCDRKEINYYFNIVDDSTTINAFALLGGYTYFYSGLLLNAENEAEIAGVIAHEIGHITAKHSVERLTAMLGYQAFIALALGKNASDLELVAANLFGSAGMLYYGKKSELEADRRAVQYMIAAGYDPNALITFFEKLESLQTHKPGRIEKLLSTHPQPSERIEKLKEELIIINTDKKGVLNTEKYLQMKQILYKNQFY